MVNRRSLNLVVAAMLAGACAAPAFAGDVIDPPPQHQNRARIYKTKAAAGQVAGGNQGDFELDPKKGYAVTAQKKPAPAAPRTDRKLAKTQ